MMKRSVLDRCGGEARAHESASRIASGRATRPKRRYTEASEEPGSDTKRSGVQSGLHSDDFGDSNNRYGNLGISTSSRHTNHSRSTLGDYFDYGGSNSIWSLGSSSNGNSNSSFPEYVENADEDQHQAWRRAHMATSSSTSSNSIAEDKLAFSATPSHKLSKRRKLAHGSAAAASHSQDTGLNSARRAGHLGSGLHSEETNSRAMVPRMETSGVNVARSSTNEPIRIDHEDDGLLKYPLSSANSVRAPEENEVMSKGSQASFLCQRASSRHSEQPELRPQESQSHLQSLHHQRARRSVLKPSSKPKPQSDLTTPRTDEFDCPSWTDCSTRPPSRQSAPRSPVRKEYASATTTPASVDVLPSALCSTSQPPEPNTDTDVDPCGICFETIDERGVLSSCEHRFCFGCIDKWFQRSCRCPHCKRVVKGLTSSKTGVSKDVVPRELRDTLEREDEESDDDIHDFMDHIALVARSLGLRVNYTQRTEFESGNAGSSLGQGSQLSHYNAFSPSLSNDVVPSALGTDLPLRSTRLQSAHLPSRRRSPSAANSSPSAVTAAAMAAAAVATSEARQSSNLALTIGEVLGPLMAHMPEDLEASNFFSDLPIGYGRQNRRVNSERSRGGNMEFWDFLSQGSLTMPPQQRSSVRMSGLGTRTDPIVLDEDDDE